MTQATSTTAVTVVGTARSLRPEASRTRANARRISPAWRPRGGERAENNTGDAADEQGSGDVEPEVAEQEVPDCRRGDEWHGLD